jgi:hypothetical protein
MLTQSQKKLYLVILSTLLLFVFPIIAITTYFVANREKVIGPTISTYKINTNLNTTTQDVINGTYKILYTKPDSEFKSRILSDNSEFGKIKTLVFEIYKGDIIMHVSIVEEDISELRNLERTSDPKLNVLNAVLEYQKVDPNNVKKLESNNLIRSNISDKDQSQVILDNSITIKKDEGESYLQSLDLFPEYTIKYRNSRLRTKINYLQSSEENYKILDSIIPTLKLIEKI